MNKPLVKYAGKTQKIKIKFTMGELRLKIKRNMGKAITIKCGQPHADSPVSREIITRSNRLGLPVINSGGKSMRDMYLETR